MVSTANLIEYDWRDIENVRHLTSDTQVLKIYLLHRVFGYKIYLLESIVLPTTPKQTISRQL